METRDAAGTFSHGLALLRNLRDSTVDSAAVFALLSTGAEKLLKLTVGLGNLVENGSWPTVKTMRDSYGHQILTLDDAARQLVRRRGHESTVSGQLLSALDLVEADEVLRITLETLTRYAEKGRFYNLDHLAADPQLEPPPSELWEQAQAQIWQADSELLRALNTPGYRRQAVSAIGGAIAQSLQRWWQTYQRAWQTNPLGLHAALWARELELFDPADPDRTPLRRIDGEAPM